LTNQSSLLKFELTQYITYNKFAKRVILSFVIKLIGKYPANENGLK